MNLNLASYTVKWANLLKPEPNWLKWAKMIKSCARCSYRFFSKVTLDLQGSNTNFELTIKA